MGENLTEEDTNTQTRAPPASSLPASSPTSTASSTASDSGSYFTKTKPGRWALNLSHCFLDETVYLPPSDKFFKSPKFEFEDGDLVTSQFPILDASNRHLSCVLRFGAPPTRKFLTFQLKSFNLIQRHDEKRVYVHYSFVYLDSPSVVQLRKSVQGYRCVYTSGEDIVVTLDVNQNEIEIKEDLLLRFNFRIHLKPTMEDSLLTHNPLTAHSGSVENFLHPAMLTPSGEASIVLRLSSQVALLTFRIVDLKEGMISFYQPVSEDSPDMTSYPMGLSVTEPDLSSLTWQRYAPFMWLVGSPNPIHLLVHHTIQMVCHWRGSVSTGIGFKLLYSIHNTSAAPVKLGSGLYDCSVPYYADFKRHFTCDMRTECNGGEDEAQCSYRSDDCGPGYINKKNKCYKVSYVKRKISWYDAYFECLKLGMMLASPKTRADLRSIRSIISTFGTPARVYYLGIKTSDLSLSTMYRELWQFADKTTAFFLSVGFIKNLWSKPLCSTVSYDLESFSYLMTSCGDRLHAGFVLCESHKPHRPMWAVRRRSQMVLNVSKSCEGDMLMECPSGHCVKDFLSCDLAGQCGVDSYLTSCNTPSADIVPMFVCDSEVQTVHYTLVCDHRQDCSDGSDETFCVYETCPDRRCDNQQCVTSDQWCDGVDDCIDRSDEECPEFVTHESIGRIDPPAVVDLDGRGGYTITPLPQNKSCPATHLQCKDGYCIPVFLRCNGVLDCIHHEDEEDCDTYTCPGLYRCRGSSICLHVDNVCDGVPHCPQRDDELLCNQTSCPVGCRCQGLAFVCTQSFPTAMYPHLRYLDASGSGLTLDDLTRNLHLVNLKLTMCRLKNLSELSFPNLRILDVSDNDIETLDMRDLFGSPNLQTLRLSRNPLLVIKARDQPTLLKHFHNLDISNTKIQWLANETLSNVPNLKSFNISRVPLTSIASSALDGTENLEVLDMRGTPLHGFPSSLLHSLFKLKTVYASDYKLCCPSVLPDNFNNKNCFAPEDAISSCDNLLRSHVYRASLWLMALLSTFGNAGSVISRLYVHRQDPGNSISVILSNLNVADFLMGVYLAVVGAADHKYRNVYLWRDNEWKGSVACRVASFLSLLSSEAAVLFVGFITLDRFVSVRCVSGGFRLKARSAAVCCAALWTFAFILASVPLLPVTSYWAFYQQSAICLPLPTVQKDFDGFFYLLIILVLNLTIFLFTALGHVCIIVPKRKNQFMYQGQTVTDVVIARRMTTVVLSEVLCWFSTSVMGILASMGIALSDQVAVFMAIFVLPLNSALNPFLLTLSIVLEKKRKAAESRLLLQLSRRLVTKRAVRHVGTMTHTDDDYDQDW